MRHLQRIVDAMTPLLKLKAPDKKSNVGALLWDIYIWQNVNSLAKKKLEQAWKVIEADKLIPDDDTLRAVQGERVILQTENLSCVIKVEPPRKIFDKDKFILRLSKKYKLPIEDLNRMAGRCYVDTKTVLTKRVTGNGRHED